MIATARNAFTHGLQVAVVVCAIVALVTAVITIVVLRQAST